MKIMGASSIAAAVLFYSCVSSAHASDDQWEFRLAPYAWATSIDTRVSHPGLPTLKVDRDFSDIIEKVDVAAMGLAEARKGDYGVLLDVIYVDMKDKAKGPFGIQAGLEFELATAMLAGQYRVKDSATGYADLLIGARWWSAKSRIDISSPFMPNLRDKRSETWVDLMIGAKGIQELNQSWFVSWSAMVGGFGMSSEWVNDFHAGIGYRLIENAAIQLGYRYIDIDYSRDGFDVEAKAYGPLLGLDYRF